MTTLRAHALPLALLAGLGLTVAVPADAPAPRATVYYVDAAATGGADDGTSWANAYTDLQDALAVAVSGDEVWVAEGTYTPHASDRDVSFEPADSVAVYGGFPAGGGAFDARDPVVHETVLSGDLARNDGTDASGNPTNRGENTYHVLDLGGHSAATVLDGLTVTAGNANQTFGEGGGLRCGFACSPTLVGVTFSANAAASEGGAVYIFDGSPSFTDATFSGNTASTAGNSEGGAVYIARGASSFAGATFTDNTAGLSGGAVYLSNLAGSSTFDDATFSGNTARVSGAVYVGAGSSTFDRATFSGNEAAGSGGAVYVRDGSSTFDDATFSGNEAVGSGGAVYVFRGDPSFTGAAFTTNQTTGANGRGGAVYVSSGRPTFTDATFSSNALTLGPDVRSSTNGGAVYVNSGSPSFAGASFSDNAMTSGRGGFSRGGAVFVNGGSPSFADATFSGNTASPESRGLSSGGAVYVSRGTPSFAGASFSDNGFSSLDDDGSWGGAVEVNGGTPSFAGASFSDNEAVDRGGAVYVSGSGSPTFANATFTGNQAAGNGGAVYVTGGTPSFAGATFATNQTTGTDGLGGAVFVNNGDPSFAGATFTGNQAVGSGGAVFVNNGDPSFAGATFTANQTTGTNGRGGAVYVSSGTPSFTDVTFSGNTAVTSGGAVYVWHASPSFADATFSGNTAVTSGGAVHVTGSGSPTFANATFAGNEAVNKGGAVYVSSGRPTFTNTILWGNTASTGSAQQQQVYRTNGTVTVTAVLVEGGCPTGADCSGGVVLDTDPHFVDADGPDDIAGTADDDLSLLATSPAIEAGDAALLPADTADLDGDGDTTEPLPLDAAGKARVFDGDLDGTAELDLGAFEFVLDCPDGVCRVDAAATGAGTGGTWDDAYSDLQRALVAAVAGDQVWVAAGTYTPHASDRAASFTPADGVAVYGGFPAGGGDGTFAARDPDAFVTVFSGDLNGDDATTGTAENARHVVHLDGKTTAATRLDGLTITAGHADGSDNDGRGAGLLCNASVGATCSPTLVRLRFVANVAGGGGGGLAVRAAGAGAVASPTLVDVTFVQNTANNGGGLFVASQSGGAVAPTVANAVFDRNTAGTWGGGAFVQGFGGTAAATFANATFSANGAGTNGGGLLVRDGSGGTAGATVENAVFWGNTGPLGAQVGIVGGATATLTAALVEGGCPADATCSGTTLSDDPRFADAAAGDLTLGPGSPAVEAGDASLLPADTADLDGDGDTTEPLPLDAAGTARAFDGDGDGTPTPDLGAFEAGLSVCPGGICYVDATGSSAGGSWADATPDLQAALALARSGDEVWVAEGTYTPSASDRTASFSPADGVAIYGGFPAGGDDGTFGARDPAAFVTVLSGDLAADDAADGSGGWTNRADNARHVLDLSSATPATVLDGLTVTAGAADGGSGADGQGGGLRCGAACSPTLTGLTFVANEATFGGAMYLGGGVAVVRDATFADNVGGDGGAVNVADGAPAFPRATFSGNQAVNGGAVYTSGSPTFASATFSDNRAATTSGGASGGAVYVDAGAPSFAGSAFVGNDAATGGGGAYVQGGSPSFASTTFAGNSATRGGAAQVLSGSTVSFSNAVLWGNTGTQAANRNQVFTVSGATTLTTALVQDGCPLNATCSGTLLTADPQFTDAAGGDASLVRGSPAMDAGDPALLPADAADLDGDGDTTEPLPLDAAGNARAQGLAVDLGAFEVTPSYDGRLTLNAEGWRMLTTPIAGTYDDLLGDRWTQGFPNADNPAGACTAYTFDEAVQGPFADGWTCLADQMAPFARASGVMAYIYADDDPTTPDDPDSRFPKSFAFTGETSPPPFADFALTFTPNPTETRAGWNLVGNPLGAAIDWDRVQIGAALGETAYVYDPELNGGGDYRVRRKGLGSLEDGVIPAFQGFFVQAYGPGPTLVVPDSAVVDGPSPDILGRRAAAEPVALQLDLGVIGAGGAVAPASTAYVSVEAGYAVGLDRGDARRLRPTAWPRAVLSTRAVGTDQPLAINVLPPDAGPVDLPLEVAAEGWAPGALALRLAASGALPDGWTAVLVDTEAGTETPLAPGDTLTLALDIPAAEARGGDLPGLGLDLGAPFATRPPVSDSAAVAARTASGAPVSTGARYALRLTPSATATEAEPVAFGLGHPAPNPSRGAVRLSFGLDAAGSVRLVVFDLLGREVLVLADGDRPAGSHEVSVDASGLAPGVYAVRLVAGERSAAARFTVVR